jgi:hypothetical protein
MEDNIIITVCLPREAIIRLLKDKVRSLCNVKATTVVEVADDWRIPDPLRVTIDYGPVEANTPAVEPPAPLEPDPTIPEPDPVPVAPALSVTIVETEPKKDAYEEMFF